MATITYHECIIPGDIADAVIQFEQETSAAVNGIQGQISDPAFVNAMNSATAQANQAMGLLDNILAYGNTSTSQLATQTYTPQADPSRLESETRLNYYGIVMIDGIAFVADKSGNIEAVRQLYFALGRDLNKTQSLLTASNPSASVVIGTVDSIQVQPITPGVVPTVSQINSVLGLNVLPEDVISITGADFVVVREYKYVSYNTNPNTLGLTSTDVAYNVFHYGALSQSAQNINMFASVGLTGNYLNAALFGNSIETLDASTLSSNFSQVNNNFTNIQDQLTFILQHPTLTASGKQTILTNTLGVTATNDTLLQENRQISYFNVTVIPELDVITKLRAQLTDADIIELFEQRYDVTGIDFSANVLNAINKAITSLPGTTVASTVGSNNVVSTISALNTQIETAQWYNDQLKTQIAQGQIAAAANVPAAVPPAATTSTAPVGGYVGLVSSDSPATLVMSTANLSKVYNINGDQLLGLAALYTELTVPLYAVARMLASANGMINQAMGQLVAAVSPVTNLLQALASHTTNLFGQGNFNSSILKCSIGAGLNINLSGPLQAFQALMAQLQQTVKNAIAKIVQSIVSAITSLLCKPINMLNAFIASPAANFNALPIPCKVTPLTLPQPVKDALQAILNTAQAQQILANSYGRNLIEVNAVFATAKQNVGSFTDGSACTGNSTSNITASLTRAQNFGLVNVPNPFSSLKAPFGL